MSTYRLPRPEHAFQAWFELLIDDKDNFVAGRACIRNCVLLVFAGDARDSERMPFVPNNV